MPSNPDTGKNSCHQSILNAIGHFIAN